MKRRRPIAPGLPVVPRWLFLRNGSTYVVYAATEAEAEERFFTTMGLPKPAIWIAPIRAGHYDPTTNLVHEEP